jgi:hypothetical protein
LTQRAFLGAFPPLFTQRAFLGAPLFPMAVAATSFPERQKALKKREMSTNTSKKKRKNENLQKPNPAKSEQIF